jgi:hypothetical protein
VGRGRRARPVDSDERAGSPPAQPAQGRAGYDAAGAADGVAGSPTADEVREMELLGMLPTLLSWAVYLSGYPMPSQPPGIAFVTHSFLVERVCAGRECNAVGWYNDERVLYIDERYRDAEDSFALSLVVHELTHYLQHLSGRYDSHSCVDSLTREREAYTVQNNFLITAQVSANIVYPGPTACKYATNTDVTLTAYGRHGGTRGE